MDPWSYRNRLPDGSGDISNALAAEGRRLDVLLATLGELRGPLLRLSPYRRSGGNPGPIATKDAEPTGAKTTNGTPRSSAKRWKRRPKTSPATTKGSSRTRTAERNRENPSAPDNLFPTAYFSIRRERGRRPGFAPESIHLVIYYPRLVKVLPVFRPRLAYNTLHMKPRLANR